MKKHSNTNAYSYMVKQVWHYAMEYRGRVVLFFVFTFLCQLIQMAQPYLIGQVFNAIQQGGNSVLYNVLYWLGISFVLKAVFWAVWWPTRLVERVNIFKVRQKYTDHIYNSVSSFPYDWHVEHHSGDTVNRMRKSSEALTQFLENHFIYMTHLANFIVPVLFLLFVAPEISLALIVFSVLIIAVVWKYDIRMKKLFADVNEKEHKLQSVFFDYIGNFTTIMSLRLAKSTKKHLLSILGKVFPSYYSVVSVNEKKWCILSLSQSGIEVLALGYFIWRQMQTGDGMIAIGTTVAVYTYLRSFQMVFFGFAADYQKLIQWQADFETAVPLLTENKNSEVVLSNKKTKWKALDVCDATYTYKKIAQDTDDRKRFDIKDINLSIQVGEKIALVGESGAGKSSLLSLLAGLRTFDSGENRIDGKSEKDWNTLYSITALIPQDTEIFENTIRFNIDLGLMRSNNNDIMEYVDIAAFSSVLENMDMGLETDIKENGVNLSGGQKQRLSLARGLFGVKDKDIILMDESTSNIDAKNERIIFENIFRKWPDKTIISSIHRLNLLSMFDRVIVMDKGRIVQDGTVEELLLSEGVLKNMWRNFNQKKDGQD